MSSFTGTRGAAEEIQIKGQGLVTKAWSHYFNEGRKKFTITTLSRRNIRRKNQLFLWGEKEAQRNSVGLPEKVLVSGLGKSRLRRL